MPLDTLCAVSLAARLSLFDAATDDDQRRRE
jgi:hypothetical protein